ncbi:hypothetical protein [Metabacillus sp. 84]|uniref:hypothetical protein n=1 Tax=unclassified Metabacillus TaxID=2675274 RepID=UPI003CE6EC34
MFNFDHTAYLAYLKLVRNVSILGMIVFIGYYTISQLQSGTGQIEFIYAGLGSAAAALTMGLAIGRMKSAATSR